MTTRLMTDDSVDEREAIVRFLRERQEIAYLTADAAKPEYRETWQTMAYALGCAAMWVENGWHRRPITEGPAQ